jgi:hypothetical protein
MGFGIYSFSESRRRSGWSALRITKHFVIRGSLLVLINFLQVFAMSFSLAPIATVLYALGINIILGSLIVTFDNWVTKRWGGEKHGYVATTIYVIVALVMSIIVTEQTRGMVKPGLDELPELNWWNLIKESVSMGGQIVAIYTPLPWMPTVLWGIMFARAWGVWKMDLPGKIRYSRG